MVLRNSSTEFSNVIVCFLEAAYQRFKLADNKLASTVFHKKLSIWASSENFLKLSGFEYM